jgi:hypothetical protein
MYLGSDSSIRTERRGSRAPVPANLKALLSDEQLLALNNVENFGWQLAFIRQPMFEQAIAVVVSPDHQRHAVLEIDGEVNLNPEIIIRH